MHCYTRSTQINNRCIDGGKSRGVLKDFRMSRVRAHAGSCDFHIFLTVRIVPIPDACAGGEYSWGEESELVMDRILYRVPWSCIYRNALQGVGNRYHTQEHCIIWGDNRSPLKIFKLKWCSQKSLTSVRTMFSSSSVSCVCGLCTFIHFNLNLNLNLTLFDSFTG